MILDFLMEEQYFVFLPLIDEMTTKLSKRRDIEIKKF